MFVRFSRQVREEAKNNNKTLRAICRDMGFNVQALSKAMYLKNFSIDLMTCIADYFQKDIIYHEGQFFMIERKERK